MTNTIPNVPRKLLERAAYTLELAYEVDTPTVRDIRALLSAPSPAGVDGLEVVATLLIDDPTDQECGDWDVEVESKVAERMSEHGGGQHELCRLSDATAIIDGLREDRDSHQRACIRAMEDRNQLAKCLKFARTTMSVVADNANLRGVEHRSLIAEVNRIDAALSAGKEVNDAG